MSNGIHLPVGYKIGGHYEILKTSNPDGDILGQGGFGIVYLVKDIHSLNKLFVVKELFLRNYSFRYQTDKLTVGVNNRAEIKEIFLKVKEDIIKEVNTLSTIENRNIVKAKGYIQENKTIYSIMEYIEGSNLEEHIFNHPFSENEAIEFLEQIINGLSEIHNYNIIHRDIKPSNIMKTKEGIYKIIDFTTSKTYSSNKTTITGIKTQGYTPPELEKRKAKIGEYSDIYSVGMTLFKLLSMQEPPRVIDRLSDDKPFQKNIDSLPISNKLKDIIKKMTKLEVRDRFQKLNKLKKELEKDEPLPPSDRTIYLLIFLTTVGIGFISYYLYTILTKESNGSSKKKDTISSHTTVPHLVNRNPNVLESDSTAIDTTEEEKKSIEEITPLEELNIDKNKMVNHLEGKDILILTNNNDLFSFESNKLTYFNIHKFSSYSNKIIFKLKNPILQSYIDITDKLKIQQFAQTVALGIHGKKDKKRVHLVITLKDNYKFTSTQDDTNKILLFQEKGE